jgi:hypothetical protein
MAELSREGGKSLMHAMHGLRRNDRSARSFGNMAISVRRASMEDVLSMQQCNLLCLPENYQARRCFHFSPPGLLSNALALLPLV